MASRTSCAHLNCEKGVGVLTCSGCDKTFCRKHSNEHHQALANELSEIVIVHDDIYKQLSQDSKTRHPILQQIDEWENESFRKIREAADDARKKVQNVIAEHRQTIADRFQLIADELHTRRETEDYLEPDLVKWREELDKLK
ncbi:unnamed protein product, partial [Didymodactylos carnosus]